MDWSSQANSKQSSETSLEVGQGRASTQFVRRKAKTSFDLANHVDSSPSAHVPYSPRLSGMLLLPTSVISTLTSSCTRLLRLSSQLKLSSEHCGRLDSHNTFKQGPIEGMSERLLLGSCDPERQRCTCLAWWETHATR